MKILSCTIVFATTLLTLLSCANSPKSGNQTSAKPSQLTQIISAYTERTKRLDPYDAPYFNIEEELSNFGDYPSNEYFDRSKANFERALEDLKAIEYNSLSEDEKLTYQIFKDDMETSLGWFKFPNRYLSVNQMGSRLRDYIDSSSEELTIFPFKTAAHYHAYVKRSEGFPAYVDRQIALMREGIKNKVVLSCTVAPRVLSTYKDALEPVIEKNPFYRPIHFMPKTISEADRNKLNGEFAKMVSERILPGYKKFDEFYQREYMPNCRKPFGLSGYKNSKEWYKWEMRANTDLDLDPAEVHQTGLKEVKRISAEIEKIKTQLGFKGTVSQFIKAKVEDPKSFFNSGEEMFRAFASAKDRIAVKIPDYFSLLPKTDFKIVEASNPEDAAGMYASPTELAPYGRFIVNTKNLKSVPVFRVMTLMIHETNPGHHMQLALIYEMKDKLSEYQRKVYGSAAFSEGWALYAEYLGNEMGLFDDPIQRFGNLNDEMLRAVRLVVDTGIHSMGWSYQRAFDYARKHLASDDKSISVEMNRYSVWPGQALGYKIGQLKILQLRRKAEAELGEKFDIKDFHKVVVGSGTVPLNVLESAVDAWIKTKKQQVL